MRVYEYRGNDINKLIAQNKGNIEDIIEGSLLDNILVSCKRGIMAIMEVYETTWSSKYRIYFSDKQSEINDIYDMWDNVKISIEGV